MNKVRISIIAILLAMLLLSACNRSELDVLHNSDSCSLTSSNNSEDERYVQDKGEPNEMPETKNIPFDFGCAMNLLMYSSTDSLIPINQTILEYVPNIPMEMVLVTSCWSNSSFKEGQTVPVRIMVLQDGNLIEHTLGESDTPVLYTDTVVCAEQDYYTSCAFSILDNSLLLR